MSLNIWEQCYTSMWGMEGDIREQVMEGKSVVDSLPGVMKGRNCTAVLVSSTKKERN